MAEVGSLEITAGVAVVATALSLFTTCCPDVNEVVDDYQSSTMRSKLDFGLPAASIATISTGIVLSFFTRSIMPTVIGFGVSAGMWVAYEVAYGKAV